MRGIWGAMLLTAVAIGASGCGAGLRFEDVARPNELPSGWVWTLKTPVAQSSAEPSFCLVSILASGLESRKDDFYDAGVIERRGGARAIYEEVKRYEPFREFRPLGSDAPDPRGCDLFVKLGVTDQTYPDGWRDERIQVYSAYTKELLWGANATDASPLLDAARQMHASFQPGTPAYAKQLQLKKGHAPLSGADVLAWAGAEMRPMRDYGVAYVPPAQKDPELETPSVSATPTAEQWWKK